MSRFAQYLQNPQVITVAEFAPRWFDQEVVYPFRLKSAVAPTVLAAHLRRSFLPTLRAGASPEALAGKRCPWDPPCALDIFRREQMRYQGLGLPKPYVISVEIDGLNCVASLRVFGAANDWFWLAAEGLGAGIHRLPWRTRLGMGAPRLSERLVDVTQGVAGGRGDCRVALISPLDVDHLHDDEPVARSLLARALQRADGLARWLGYVFSDCDAILEQIDGVLFDERTTRHNHFSPNSKRQNRNKRVALGEIRFSGLTPELGAVLAMAERAHIGRGAVEGLGRIAVEVI